MHSSLSLRKPDISNDNRQSDTIAVIISEWGTFCNLKITGRTDTPKLGTGSLAKVETNKFARADLEHELLMLDDDMKLEALPQTNTIKAIVTAELPMDLGRVPKSQDIHLHKA